MVNIIIPVYNSLETLPDTLNSLVAQTKKMFLVTLVQDCDGLDYSSLIEEYTKRGLHISLLHTEVNSGPGVARQLGIDKTKMCDYVMFCDSDDIYYPCAVELLYREAKKKNADIVISNIEVEKKYEPGYLMEAGKAPITWFGGKIYKLDYLRKNNIRCLDCLRLNEDSYFNLVAANMTKNKLKINYTTYLWRDNSNSLTRKENYEDFFKKSSFQYILSQVKGLEKLLNEFNITDNLISATLKNIYECYEKMEIMGLDLIQSNSLISQLLHHPKLETWNSNVGNWKKLIDSIKTGTILYKKPVFYNNNFENWYNFLYNYYNN